MTAAISVRNVWKEFGDQIVLEDVSIEIAPRAFVALVGPSGCGKTTFLRMLLSQEQPSRGTILVDDRPIAKEPDADRGIVFQRYSVFPHLTALGNVLLGAEFAGAKATGRLFGRARAAAIEEARALLTEVGLAGQEEKYPAALSGGMQQRLALAQALMRKPRILLLDEPFGALDPGIRAEIHGLMRYVWNSCDITVVMVTHDLSEAFGLGTRVVAFERPRGRPEERARYGARITRDFALWPPRRPTALAASSRSGRDDAANPEPRRDDPAALPEGS
ncbi:ATP-binding cassette domain-containing protein [Prosthecomicrobium pneumaticum]|uniref:NitT/TauT family transport system ATP-binding protein n=1 Tax=Prosthecomicrobium pneumaticum TaxID=81895 RepID=A0A7W9FQ73_9HYPH|nr:ATP-binding cassette domain-containing protein [Prosthecomicrobium pneumaticum]MBB5754857.1 NitT/TauT family transport system ATP-binding protein [Prosthecomicrobium pneumaticum]